jgi:alginate O-acetyltransferase complex protein AlgI
MLFNSDVFIFGFLPAALLGYYLLSLTGRRAAAAWLIAASFVFYGWWNPAYVALLALSVTFNYLCGLAIAGTATTPRRQTAVLVFSIAVNLGTLFYYKYLFALLSALHNSGIVTSNLMANVILPLGISFFTFTQIGYLVDCKQGVAKERGVLDYFLFVTFFPHLIAGPILHHGEIMSQFADRKTYRFRSENLSVGFTIFAIGLAKKVLLADGLGLTADAGFEHPQTLQLLGAWSTVLSYSLQLYFDFSGYSDMAIGVARMFGVRFPLNFNSPYKARCIIDFWQRWHMTLTRYITLYLYNPVVLWVTRRRVARGYGISRRATATPSGFLNMIVLPTAFTMAIAGVWHGAGLQFLIFGLLHGAYLSVNHAWRIFGPRQQAVAVSRAASAALAVGQVLLTYLAVLVGQIFFRASSAKVAFKILAELVGLHGANLHGADLPAVSFHGNYAQTLHVARLVSLFVICWALPNTQQIMAQFEPSISKFEPGSARIWRWQPTLAWAGVIALLFIATLGGRLGDPARFLYFQF